MTFACVIFPHVLLNSHGPLTNRTTDICLAMCMTNSIKNCSIVEQMSHILMEVTE